MESITPTNLVTTAVRKLGGVQAGEDCTPTEITDGVSACNLLLDTWRTQELAVPINVREVFAIATGQDALTIGSGGQLNTVRPETISAASILLNAPSTQSITSITFSGGTATATKVGHGYVTGMQIMISGANEAAYNGAQVITRTSSSVFTFPVVGSPTTPATGTILARDMIGDNSTQELYLGQWTYSGWISQVVKGQTNPYPTRFYYDRAYQSQLGTIYTWPNSTQANVFVLYMPRPVSALDPTALTTAVYMAPGYIRALVYNLAVELAPEYGTDLNTIPSVVKLADDSLSAIKRYNDEPTVMSTGDAGVLFSHGRWYQGGYNIYTGP